MAELMVKPLSQKAINSIANTGYLNVWEGAVRSGKTVASSVAWITYVAQSPEKYFIMTGKTISTLYRNVIGGEFGMLAMLGKMGEYKIDREGNRVLIIKPKPGVVKICYCFGGHDESSYQVMRGLTAGGWYADEINLHPQSFIEEAFRRTIVSQDRKHMWTLNPDNPRHWIYTEYIDKFAERDLKGFYLWHFTLEDNLAIPPERKEELKMQFSGIFYRRYILGERVLAEGTIYDMITDDTYYTNSSRPYQLERISIRKISADHGTTNPCHFLDIYDDGKTIWVDNEYRWDSKSDIAMKLGIGQKTDAQYGADMDEFMATGPYCDIILDPSAASFAAELRSRGYSVIPAENEVVNGINIISSLIHRGLLKINKDNCPFLIKEMEGYAWDPVAAMKGEEKPIKVADHGPDALRYYGNTAIPAWRVGVNHPTKGFVN